jgi:uncharacterized membrane protein
MTTETLKTRAFAERPAIEPRRAGAGEPLRWLRAGWRDFAAAPAPSLLYGSFFALGCWGVLALVSELPGFTLAFLTGLLLIGPFLASGLYVAARQRERGEPVSVRAGIAHLWSRRTNLGLFAVLLALVMAAWVRLSALLFAVKFNSLGLSIEAYTGLISGASDPWVLAYFVGIGFVLALTVFVIGAVSIPMIVDRDTGPVTAIRTSARVVARNWPAMSLWAASIVLLTGLGIATWFAGMVVLFPVLGYATWHSFRRLVA